MFSENNITTPFDVPHYFSYRHTTLSLRATNKIDLFQIRHVQCNAQGHGSLDYTAHRSDSRASTNFGWKRRRYVQKWHLHI